jgi:hypothetical protein
VSKLSCTLHFSRCSLADGAFRESTPAPTAFVTIKNADHLTMLVPDFAYRLLGGRRDARTCHPSLQQSKSPLGQFRFSVRHDTEDANRRARSASVAFWTPHGIRCENQVPYKRTLSHDSVRQQFFFKFATASPYLFGLTSNASAFGRIPGSRNNRREKTFLPINKRQVPSVHPVLLIFS